MNIDFAKTIIQGIIRSIGEFIFDMIICGLFKTIVIEERERQRKKREKNIHRLSSEEEDMH